MGIKITALSAMLSGFVFLSYEILFLRIASFVTKSHPATFGVVLGVYLLGLGSGVALVRRFVKNSRDEIPGMIVKMLFLSSILCYLVIPMTSFFSAHWFYAARFGLFPLFLAACSFGGIFPLLVRVGVEDESTAGNSTGLIYGANIAGSTLGSFICGFLLLDVMSAASISLLLAIILLLLAVLTIVFFKKSIPQKMLIIPLCLIGVFSILNTHFHSRLYEKLLYMPRSRMVPPFEQIIENRSGVICVERGGRVYGDGVYDGVISTSLSPKRNPEIENAYFAFLFKPDAVSILEIGLATGSWAQVLVNGPEVRSLTSVEINPGFLKLIRRYKAVQSLLVNPRFKVIIDDGRRWLRRNQGRKFDLIVVNNTFHWRNHSTNLLSLEFLQLLKKHLQPGGVVYLNTTFSRHAVHTIAKSFKHTYLYRVYMIASDSPMLINRKRFAKILKDFTIDGRPVLNMSETKDRHMLDKLVSVPLQGTCKEILTRTKGTKIITDDNMITEFGFLRRHIFKKRKEDYY